MDEFETPLEAIKNLEQLNYQDLPALEQTAIIKALIHALKQSVEATNLLKTLVDTQQTTIDLQNVVIVMQQNKKNKN